MWKVFIAVSYCVMRNNLFTLFILLLFTGCLNAVCFNIEMNEPTNIVKTSHPNGKVVQRFFTFPYHGGSIVIQNDFAFDKDLVIDVSEAKVSYKKAKWNLHFIGNDLYKDSIHIDSDENLTTLFSVPSWYKFGDTLRIDFDGFLKDLNGTEYQIKPVLLILRKSEGRK